MVLMVGQVVDPTGVVRPATEATTSRPTTAGPVEVTRSARVDVSVPRLRASLLQTALAREGFSPGVIDGKIGGKTQTALRAFQKSRGLPASGELDEATAESLGLAETDSFIGLYRVTADDLALITGEIPTDWNERARLPLSGYAHLEELLAERGWCSVEHVRFLNPGVDLSSLRAGDTVELPTVKPKRLPTLERLEIDLTNKLVRGFDAGGDLVLLLHCSIAREVEKRPMGNLRVEVVATDPDYTFSPASWPEVKNVKRRLRIAPGPRNPVGLAWVGLDKPGYGIHGTPRPQDIGKTGSHGCFRLANWDAVRLAKSVRIGTVVEVRE
jgi:lipoprotein-anchoring transpeptidase ErfK/SrfK